MSEHPMPVPQLVFQQAASAVWGERIRALVPREYQSILYRFVGCSFEVRHYDLHPLRVSSICMGIGNILVVLTNQISGDWILWPFAIPIAFGALVLRQITRRYRDRRNAIICDVARALEHDPQIDVLVAKIGMRNSWRRSRT